MADWRDNPVFGALDEDERQRVIDRYPVDQVPPRQIILQGERVEQQLHVLLCGSVRIYHRSADGREVVVKILRAPGLFAEFEIFTGLAMLEWVDALDHVHLARIPKDEYFALLMRNPAAMFEHLRHLATAFAIAARNERHIFCRLDQRIANLLLTFAELEQLDPQNEPRRLPQTDITRSLGAVHRSVARIIRDWKEKGWVEQRPNETWELVNIRELEALAAPIRDSLIYQMGMPLTGLDEAVSLTQACLEVITGHPKWIGKRFSIGEDATIGRQLPSAIVLPDQQLSPLHCRIFRAATGGRFWLEDLDSLNGCQLNGRVVKRAVLQNDDEIRVGAFRLRLEIQ
jgi:CRP-like cAMP-binding protein